jgi:DNA-binding beta-propeller fold protein YncE
MIAGLFAVALAGTFAPLRALPQGGETFPMASQPVSLVGLSTNTGLWLLATFPDEDLVRVLDTQGQVVAQYATVMEPLGIALAPKNRRVYIGSGKDGRVDAFTIKGRNVSASIGGLGVGDGEFQRPVAIAVSPLTREAYVADVKRGDVRIYAPKTLQQVGSVGAGTLTSPCGLAFDSQGNLFVSDMMEGEVYKFLADGTYTGWFTRQGADPGETVRPIGLAVDGQDQVYVVDAFFGRVQTYSPSGQWLGDIGTIGTGPGLMRTPLDVAMHRGQARLYVSDSEGLELESFAITVGSTVSTGGQ